jgi:ribonucleotide reductase beta subunit family protein with ferritin-like domain
MALLPIETHNPLFGKYLYPEAKEVMEKQQDVTWAAQEIPVEGDKQDYLVKMTPSQHNLAVTTLQSFVEVEQTVGEVWETFASWFPHSEIQGCCIEIARMEKSVHAFFYQKMSDVLNIDPSETAEQQQAVKSIKNKLTLLKDITTNLEANKPLSLFTVAAIEQSLLFGNFAMLKSFKANGNNLIKKTLTGVDYVIQDEQLHGVFASFLHNQYINELSSTKQPIDQAKHTADCIEVIKTIVKHEDAVIDYVYSNDTHINDITAEELKIFIRSRANLVLNDMGFEPLYPNEPNPIADWFYQGVNSIKVHDFFSANTTQYRRNWKFDNFSFFQGDTNATNE